MLSGGLAPAAFAADDDISWAVQPSSAEGPDGRDVMSYTLSPGDTVTDYVGVSNLGHNTLSMRVYAMDAAMTTDGSFTLPPASTPSVDVGNWVGITGEGTYTIEPGQRLDIPFRLTVPPTASPGDHAGGIVASLSELGTSGDGAQQVSVDRRVGVRLYVNIPGERTPHLEVSDVTVNYDGGWDLFGGTSTVTYSVKNTGNVRLGGTAALTLTGLLGWSLGAAEDRQLPDVLPGSTVEFTETVTGVAPAVFVNADVSLTPTSVGDAGDDVGTNDSASGWALALPYTVLIIILLLAGLIFWLWWRGRRWRTQAKAALAGTASEHPQPTA
ncbi:hypothetical protein GCM10022198_09540 [Klugiella xanthotipulae]